MTSSRSGSCQCGKVRYVAEGEPILVALCHCSMCRRAHAAPMVAWAMFEQERVRFDGERAIHASTPGVGRGFCASCGTQISFVADYIPGLIDLTVGSFDRPEDLPPAFHYWEDERLAWLKVEDGLPRHAGFLPQE